MFIKQVLSCWIALVVNSKVAVVYMLTELLWFAMLWTVREMHARSQMMRSGRAPSKALVNKAEISGYHFHHAHSVGHGQLNHIRAQIAKMTLHSGSWVKLPVLILATNARKVQNGTRLFLHVNKPITNDIWHVYSLLFICKFLYIFLNVYSKRYLNF